MCFGVFLLLFFLFLKKPFDEKKKGQNCFLCLEECFFVNYFVLFKKVMVYVA
jgi:hypothetical protein